MRERHQGDDREEEQDAHQRAPADADRDPDVARDRAARERRSPLFPEPLPRAQFGDFERNASR